MYHVCTKRTNKTKVLGYPTETPSCIKLVSAAKLDKKLVVTRERARVSHG